MTHRYVLAAASITAVVALSGCGILGNATDDGPAAGAPAATATTPAATDPSPTSEASTGLGSVKDAGDIPDPCTLLSRDEVNDLTNRKITQIDEDGAAPGATTRFCQWQQESGQLAVFLSRTTEDDFKIAINGAVPVDGVGEDAFQLAGHLYVLYGTVQIDVYSRGDTDEQNLTDAKKVAKLLLPRV